MARSGTALVGFALFAAGVCAAADFPQRPIRMIVPSPAGGGMDNPVEVDFFPTGECLGTVRRQREALLESDLDPLRDGFTDEGCEGEDRDQRTDHERSGGWLHGGRTPDGYGCSDERELGGSDHGEPESGRIPFGSREMQKKCRGTPAVSPILPGAAQSGHDRADWTSTQAENGTAVAPSRAMRSR